MITAVAFVVAAGVGAPARAEAGRRWNRHEGLAWGTLIVHVVGSFALGLLHGVGPPTVTIIGVGGLGAFTTFSSFARHTVARAEARQFARCVAYVTISCSVGIGAAAFGMAIAWLGLAKPTSGVSPLDHVGRVLAEPQVAPDTAIALSG